MLTASNADDNRLGPRLSGPFTPIGRQTSIYSLTLDELQNNYESGKNFGSMNMDEFLKNIWTAEETQAMAAVMPNSSETTNSQACTGDSCSAGLVRQGSLLRQVSLPRTLSGKTVDEVWKDIQRDSDSEVKNQQKQANYGEMTLEDFLVKAGVVREENLDNTSNSATQHNVPELVFPFRAGGVSAGTLQGVTSFVQGNHQVPTESTALQKDQGWINYHPSLREQQQQHHLCQQQATEASYQQQFCFQKQPTNAFAAAFTIASTRTDPTLVALPGTPSDSGMDGSSDGAVGLQLSPAINSSDTLTRCKKRNHDGVVETTVERRQRRMIKNRESAARSRARKQAYTVELEAEVTQLKEENTRLKKQQISKMLIPITQAPPPKKALRRTRTNSW